MIEEGFAVQGRGLILIMQLKVFLTGATGYIGGAVADALLAAGHTVTGLARSDEAARKLSAGGIAPTRGDLHSPASWSKAAGESDGVIHAGTTNDGRIDQEAVRVMLDALRDSGKPLLYTSGIWVLGDTGGKIADETWPVNPVDLVAWRPGVEQLVLAAARNGVRSMVIRPGVVYGRGSGIPADFVKSAHETGAARYVGTGQNRWPLVHVDDLADLYVRAFEHAAAGTMFLATDGSGFRVREIAEAASFGAGAGGRTESWPLEEARKTLGAYADALVLDQLVSSEKARTTLGWQIRASSLIEDLRRGNYAK
jgi:nucleoside-diphosphate-sugar epimerase